MTIQKINWSPDWCTCSVTYEYDRDLPPENITFTGSAIINKCPAHQNITDPAQLYNVLHEETTLKERSRQAIVESLSSELVNIDPETQTRSHDPEKVDITFNFTGANPVRRNLEASFNIRDTRLKLRTADRTALATTLTTRLTNDTMIDPTKRSRISIIDNDDSTRTRLNG